MGGGVYGVMGPLEESSLVMVIYRSVCEADIYMANTIDLQQYPCILFIIL